MAKRDLVVLDREPGKFHFSAFYNVSIVVWVTQADSAAVARLKRALAKLAAEYPDARSCVTVVGAGVLIPRDEAARANLVELLNRSADQLVCLPFLAEGKGFERSALLAFQTSLRTASVGGCAMALFEDIASLARWTADHHRKSGGTLDASSLADAVRQAIEEAHPP